LTEKPATAFPEIVFTVILSYVSASNCSLNRLNLCVHVVLGSHMRPCKPSAFDLTITNTWVRLQQSSQGGSL